MSDEDDYSEGYNDGLEVGKNAREALRAENDSLKSVIEDNAKLVLHIRMENEALRAALKKWEDTGLQKNWPITYDENTQGCWLAEAGAAKAALGESDE